MQQLRAMCEIEAENTFDQIYAIWMGSQHLTTLLSGSYLNVSFCRETAELLLSHLGRLREYLEPKSSDPSKQKDTPPPLKRFQLYGLRSDIEKFEHQFSAELKRQAAYTVPRQDIFQTDLLVDNAQNRIHESVRDAVPEFAQSEFKWAGRCLAFRLFSASGYHSARAVAALRSKRRKPLSQ